ncbi:hypothetical protein [Synoicihabitans lomoniglobus]|uniref:Uncharacterized protein n=1 Tax=Synoicihabitans lomoniglobus TaxID=2909285 RepID=A0AAF0CQN8_9BACT|nr:hypothetical protein [Opitutaceae bacterium LMO-M01]WED66277.1 hypothetical protein PXH66_05375 [Opitutaceae bacterium LMO-M01]
MNVLLILFGVYLIIAAIIGVMLKRAPQGYEDATGFHNGQRPLLAEPEKNDAGKIR